MALTNTGITSTIVANEIGAASRKWSVLCKHPNINKWSKWKPVRVKSDEGLVEADLKFKNYGFNIPFTTEGDYSVALQEWVYEKPRGGVNEPYRIGDFRNYNHNALEPLYIVKPLSYNALSGIGGLAIQTELMQSSLVQIGIDDFSGEIGNSYFGVVMKTPNNQLFIKTASGKLSTRDTNLVIESGSAVFNYNTVDMYFVLSSQRVASVVTLSSLGLVKLMAIPSNTRHFKVPIISEFKDLVELHYLEASTSPTSGFANINNYASPNGQYFSSGGQGNAYFKVLVRNNDSSTFILTRSKIRMGLSKLVDGSISNNTYEPLMYNSSGTSVTSISIAAGQEVYVTLGYGGMFTDKGNIMVMPGERTSTQVKLQYNYSGSGYLNWVFSREILISS